MFSPSLYWIHNEKTCRCLNDSRYWGENTLKKKVLWLSTIHMEYRIFIFKIKLKSAGIMKYNFTIRWRANMILKDVPKPEWPMLRLKVLAAAAIGGRRSDWGSRRKWEGNYLAMVRPHRFRTLISKNSCVQFIWSMNRFSFGAAFFVFNSFLGLENMPII